MNRLSGKLTYANVISTLCLILLVGGGTAYAASEMLPNNSVGTKQLLKEAVTPAKLSKASKAALTGPQGPKGDAGAKGDPGIQGGRGETGPRGPSNAYYAFNNALGTNAKTLSLSVPAGNYVASGSMYAVLQEVGITGADCSLTSSTESNNEGKADVSLYLAAAGAFYAHPQVEAALNVGSGGTIILSCSKFGTPSISLYQARILATRVESIN